MPITIYYEQEPDGLIVELSGRITGQDIIRINDEIRQLTTPVFQLWDLSRVKDLTISASEMHEIAVQDSLITGDSKLEKVALVGSDSIFQTQDEAYHFFSGKWVGRQKDFQSRTFQDLTAARRWITDDTPETD